LLQLELQGTEVLNRKEGDSLVLTPVRKHKLRDLLAYWTPMDDVLPEAEDPPPQQRDPL
jgi:antitoxin VapB